MLFEKNFDNIKCSILLVKKSIVFHIVFTLNIIVFIKYFYLINVNVPFNFSVLLLKIIRYT